MQIFISPAKTLEFDQNLKIGEFTEPYFLREAIKVNSSLKRKSRRALADMQGISKNLAELNYHRNQNWSEEANSIAQAAMAFKGDVYIGMKAQNWSVEDMLFANDHLNILSGLYGILRPTDIIKPYRLEMGTSLKVGRRDNLYQFWKDKLENYFKEFVPKDELLLNLASQEYFKAISTSKIQNRIINIDFKDLSKGDYKVLSFFAKKARGMMANFIIQNKIDEIAGVKEFSEEGYYFSESLSIENHYIFLRDNQDIKNALA